MAGLLDYLSNVKFEPNAAGMGLLNMGAQILANSGPSALPQSPFQSLSHGINGFSQGFDQQRAIEAARAAAQQKALLDAATIRKDDAMSGYYADKANSPNSGTPGQWFIPSGSEPYSDETTGFVGYKTKDGSLIPSRSAMTEYQQKMTDPTNRGAVKAAEVGEQMVKVTLPDGREVMVQSKHVPGYTPTAHQPANYGSASFALSPDASPEDRAAMAALRNGINPQAPIIKEPKDIGAGQGQSTAAEESAKITGKAAGSASADLNTRLSMYNQIIHEADMGIKALNPKEDGISKQTIYGLETGGILPGARKLWGDTVTNDPRMRDIETAAAMKGLMSAQDYLKGQGSVTDAERKLITEVSGIDPYKFDSKHNHERFLMMKQKAEAAKEAAMKAAQGDFSPTQPAQPSADDLVKQYLGGK